MKTRYYLQVTIQNGKIVKSVFNRTDNDQQKAIKAIKTPMNSWLKTKIANHPELANSTMMIKARYTETIDSLKLDLKIQSVDVNAGSTASTK